MKRYPVIFQIQIITVLLLLCPALYAQSGIKLKHAEILMAEGKYEKAIEKYLKLFKKDSMSLDVNLGLGILFEEYIYDEDAALPFLERAYRLTKKDTQPELIFALGKCKLHNEKYDEARKLFKQAVVYVTPNADGRVLKAQIEKYIENCNIGTDYNIKVQSRRYRIKHLGPEINTHYPEYAPVSDSNQTYLLFTTRRPENVGKQKDVYDGKAFEDIYLAEKNNGKFMAAIDLDAPVSLMENYLNTQDHDAVVNMTADGKTLFIYKENGLYTCQWNGTAWGKFERLPEVINMPESYEPHVALSPNGKTLVFSSNRPGGMGGLDLYACTLTEAGTWSDARNLGTWINTLENEDGPYFSHDGKELYFSSKGLSGYGGYDIFVADFDGKEFGTPRNLEPPINSPNDDIYISFNRDKTTGFFASSRKGGYGDMDIYQFHEMSRPSWSCCNETIKAQRRPSSVYFTSPDTVYVNELSLFNGSVSNFKNEYPYHYYWKVNDSIMPNDSSRFFNYFRRNGVYKVSMHTIVYSDSTGERENYCFSKNVYVIERPKLQEVKIEPVLNKDESKIVIEGTADLKKIDTTQLEVFKINLETIYFDLNKSTLRKDASATMDANVNKLKVNKKIIIKITAHTDSRATKDYNMKLSAKRSQAVINYLAKKGIGKNRILAVVNMGADEPENNCKGDKDCIEKQHQLNRKVDFKVIGVQPAVVPKVKKPGAGKGKKNTSSKKK